MDTAEDVILQDDPVPVIHAAFQRDAIPDLPAALDQRMRIGVQSRPIIRYSTRRRTTRRAFRGSIDPHNDRHPH